eukprot:CAMPEP_0198153668 /NCGR_PEP_ID=MMETSP1443-20131203/65174_1 /TAXON_ID=186043 /ORGANISM="Entomoneis sp., Strain CCMP2396" /LENGTH=205 /DNA_ID=CAMNT_0043820081 /DNA_START=90 /DNA_END=707 /DNA_ORIENTATION=-
MMKKQSYNYHYFLTFLLSIYTLKSCDGFAPQFPRSPLAALAQPLLASTRLNGWFGGGVGQKSDATLAVYKGISGEKRGALTEYIVQWAQLFESDGKGMGLTTPVKAQPLENGVRLIFQKVRNTGYSDKAGSSKSEEKPKEGEKKKKEARQGGVEMMVEELDDGSIQVRAQRCEIDEETLIKEMSEETILNKLKKAIEVWKKDNVQ